MSKPSQACVLAGLIALSTPILLAAGDSPPPTPLPLPAVDADFYDGGLPNRAEVQLGKLLFFDKLLSGNRNTSCATCHHALTDTADGLSLSVGEGGRGLGVTRDTGSGADAIHERVPRNAPHVFNLGAKQFEQLFHDGRVAVDRTQPSGFASPAGDDLPLGLANPLAVQAMFPVTSATEMAGQPGENSIADATALGNLSGPGGVWEQLGQRLRANPEYVRLFRRAYPGLVQTAADVSYVHAANAIAAFEAQAWRATDSPFDRFLAGEADAMSPAAIEGMNLFYGRAGCSSCHSGTFLTDQSFHAIAMPQIGPGRGDGRFGYEDYGRAQVTGLSSDRYKFRTPALRNVALTGPWGHDGAFNSLEAMVRHQLDASTSLLNYDTQQAVLPSRPDLDALDFLCHDDTSVQSALLDANELPVIVLGDDEVQRLIDFLHALTDPASVDLRSDMPDRVPSGLPLYE